MTDQREAPDSRLPTLATEPTDSSDRADPMEPIDSTDPTEPIDSTDPVEAMDSTESRDRHDQRDLPPGTGVRTGPRSPGRGRLPAAVP